MSRPDVNAMATEVVLLVKSALTPVLERLAVAESRLLTVTALHHATENALKANGDLRERLAVLEARPLPVGEKGERGEPGQDGKAGAPGLEWKGIYHDEDTYDPGQIAKWGGSTYVCLKTTTGVKPDALPHRTMRPDGTYEYDGVCGKDFWDLFVSKGDPGRAAK